MVSGDGFGAESWRTNQATQVSRGLGIVTFSGESELAQDFLMGNALPAGERGPSMVQCGGGFGCNPFLFDRVQS